MRTVGIVAEYNPFHSGHAYHIRKAKEATGSEYAVVVMSPDFVQRGEPAVFDKFTRAEMALRQGADLVLELPVCYATGSAESFAGGAVALLTGLGAVSSLCFGAEAAGPAPSGTLSRPPRASDFMEAAGFLLEERVPYRTALADGLRQGLTFPQARARAAALYAPGETAGLLDSPNNLLGVEYCKALQKQSSPLIPVPILRLGNGYFDDGLSGAFCSATALRKVLKEQGEMHFSSSPSSPALAQRSLCLREEAFTAMRPYIPEACLELFQNAIPFSVFPDDFLPVLHRQLLWREDFRDIQDFSPELSDRLWRLRFSCMGLSFSGTVSALKTRQVTEARIRRALLHLILELRSEETERFYRNGPVFYARILGFRRESAALLGEIKKRSTVPLLSKPSRASSVLCACGQRMWETDVRASHLYRSVRTSVCRAPFQTEYECSPIVLSGPPVNF